MPGTVVPVDGWKPVRTVRYPAVVVDVPLPVATVELRGDPAGIALVRAGLTGSPHVREETGDRDLAAGDRFLVLAEAGGLVIARADLTPLTAPVPATPDGAATLVQRLEHLARWHLVKSLDNPLSGITGQVKIEILQARRSELPPRDGRAPITESRKFGLDPGGDYRARSRSVGRKVTGKGLATVSNSAPVAVVSST